MKAYEGNDYIFVSYARKDCETFLPIIEKMQGEKLPHMV